MNSRVGAEPGAFRICLINDEDIIGEPKNTTHRMHSLVTPTIGRPHIAIAVNRLSATTPQRLVPCSLSNTLYFSTFVVVADETAAISVLDVKIALMATDTMERRRNDQVGEEGGEIG